MMTTEEMIMYDQLVEFSIATAEEINLAFNVSGKSWGDVLTLILYHRTGYTSLADYLIYEQEDYVDYDEEEE